MLVSEPEAAAVYTARSERERRVLKVGGYFDQLIARKTDASAERRLLCALRCRGRNCRKYTRVK